MVFQPPIVAQRLSSQHGWFTVHKDLVTKNKKASFLPLELQSKYKRRLIKFRIRASHFELRTELEKFGITNATLFPDLDGLSRYITWKNTIGKDEFAINVKTK
jgi:hypothetical protein